MCIDARDEFIMLPNKTSLISVTPDRKSPKIKNFIRKIQRQISPKTNKTRERKQSFESVAYWEEAWSDAE